VGLERGPLSLVNTTEKLLERKSCGSGLEIEITAVGIRRAPRNTLYPQELALISPTSSVRSVGIVRSRTKATESLLLTVVIYIIAGDHDCVVVMAVILMIDCDAEMNVTCLSVTIVNMIQ
jgi:hypothetical protein